MPHLANSCGGVRSIRRSIDGCRARSRSPVSASGRVGTRHAILRDPWTRLRDQLAHVGGLVRAGPANGMRPRDPGRDFAPPETARPPDRGRSSQLGDAQPAQAVETLTTSYPSRHALSGCFEAAGRVGAKRTGEDGSHQSGRAGPVDYVVVEFPIDKGTSSELTSLVGSRPWHPDLLNREVAMATKQRPSGRRNSSATRSSRWT